MYELIINLDNNSKTPLYEQIYIYIKNQIKQGYLVCDTKLPSTRFLAQSLQVSRSTIDMAYLQLISEGYVESVPCKGYFVSDISLMCDLVEKHVTQEKMTLPEKIHYDIDFSPWGIDMEHFPFSVWRKLSKSVLSVDNRDLFLSGDNKGEKYLRDSIAQYLYQARGINIHPDNIILGAGNEYLLMVLNQLLEHHPVVAMENSTYKQAYLNFTKIGNKVVIVDDDESGISVNALNNTEANLVYVMPSHQYPFGSVMPVKRRMELVNWTQDKSDRYILEDDYDSEFRYIGKPIPALLSTCPSENVIYLGTFSKSIAPGIRMSYMVLPQKLLKRYENSYLYAQTVSRIDQRVVGEFIRDGYYERHLNRMRNIYRAKHDTIVRECRNCFGNCISGENAGLHILLEFDGNEKNYIDKAAEHGIRVYGLSEFTINPQRLSDNKAVIILGYANLKDEQIINGIQKLQKAWDY